MLNRRDTENSTSLSGAGSLFFRDAHMTTAQSDNLVAKKLNTFLSQDELKFLAGLQGHSLNVRRGQQLTREGQTEHKAFVLQGLQLQDPA
jgi:hypothetical protein